MKRVHHTLLVGAAVVATAGVVASLAFKPSLTSGRTDTATSVSNKHALPFSGALMPATRKPGLTQPGLSNLPQPVASPHPPGSPQHQQWLATRIAELDDLAWFDNAQSLHRILAELRNPLPEIQAAALSATRAFGSRDAIPFLEALAADPSQTLDRQSITDAIAFLNLPTMLEQLTP